MEALQKEVKQLREEVEKIHQRNRRVEADKAWEISFTRSFFIAVSTYFLIFFFLVLTNADRPFLNAFLAAAGYLLSTFSYGVLKKWWLERQKTK
ncbi:MAG TPA: hypothetical protein VJC10_03815 [Patescibacteria group bacterium]|nr:hypothetical protein [Patescibacteria group bacterium]